jgi:hypothetical protein
MDEWVLKGRRGGNTSGMRRLENNSHARGVGKENENWCRSLLMCRTRWGNGAGVCVVKMASRFFGRCEGAGE